MNEMPKYIKEKLRQYAKAQYKAGKLADELARDFEKYNVPYDNLVACTDDYDHSTEALAYINNCELSNLEESISEIEKVFLYFTNKK